MVWKAGEHYDVLILSLLKRTIRYPEKISHIALYNLASRHSRYTNSWLVSLVSLIYEADFPENNMQCFKFFERFIMPIFLRNISINNKKGKYRFVTVEQSIDVADQFVSLQLSRSVWIFRFGGADVFLDSYAASPSPMRYWSGLLPPSDMHLKVEDAWMDQPAPQKPVLCPDNHGQGRDFALYMWTIRRQRMFHNTKNHDNKG